jgi:putative membrane protein
METVSHESSVLAVDRPHRNLLTYYLLGSFVLGPLFFILLIPAYFRYHTLRYRFDDEGVSARWGILFRKEIHLTYARIQDIHLRSNFVERWLKLARVEIQTASGSAKAELTVEGLLQFEAVRDFLYSKMRGIKSPEAQPNRAAPTARPESAALVEADLAATLREVANELRGIRSALESRSAKGPSDV